MRLKGISDQGFQRLARCLSNREGVFRPMKPETIERRRLEWEENKKRKRELFLKNYEIAKSDYPYLPEPPLEGNSMSYNNEEDDTSTIITSNGITHF